MDTGTSLITPPREVIHQISEMLDKGHITDCSDMSKFPTLQFNFGDVELSLPPEAYVGVADNETDLPGFKHEALAFPLLPLRLHKPANKTLALKQGFPLTGSCAILMSEG